MPDTYWLQLLAFPGPLLCLFLYRLLPISPKASFFLPAAISKHICLHICGPWPSLPCN